MSQHFSFSLQDTETFKRTLEKFKQELTSRWDDVSNQWSNLEATWYDQEYDKFAPLYEKIAYLYEEASHDLINHQDFLQRQIESSNKLAYLALYLDGFSPSPLQSNFLESSAKSQQTYQEDSQNNKKINRKKVKQQLDHFKAVLGVGTLLLPTQVVLPCEFSNQHEVVICCEDDYWSPILVGLDDDDALKEGYLLWEEERNRRINKRGKAMDYTNSQPKESRDYFPPN